MHIIFILLLLLALLYGPTLWVNWVMNRHRREESFPFSGAELAHHLIEELHLEGVTVETTPEGDHYDPTTGSVRLHPLNHDGRNLTAIAIAAHEVGHALQHARNERPFLLRQQLVGWSGQVQRLGGYAMVGVPLAALLTRHPMPSLALLLIGLATLAATAVVHFVTLPVEFDASFNKALPLLNERDLLDQQQQHAAQGILKAAAYTYVAGSLASLLNVWYWLRMLRR